jgi:hypothetical protein
MTQYYYHRAGELVVLRTQFKLPQGIRYVCEIFHVVKELSNHHPTDTLMVHHLKMNTKQFAIMRHFPSERIWHINLTIDEVLQATFEHYNYEDFLRQQEALL